MRNRILISLVLACLGSGAAAATVNETDFAGGFSSPNQFFNPTYTDIGYGIDTINGTANAGNFDFIRLTGLDAGAQSLTFSFALVIPAAQAGQFSNAGGQLYYSDAYESGPYNGTNAGSFGMAVDPFNPPGTPTTSLSFNLDAAFAGGDLFVNILPQFGNRDFSYSIALTGNGGGPAPVPLPPAGILLLAALGLLGWSRRTGGADLHPGSAQAT